MNNSYVFIELDTTAPKANIFAPSYTTQDIVNEIIVEANEKISDIHEIWIIDSEGERHDYVFTKIKDNEFLGLVRLNNLPFGISTIYARVSDDVGNISEIASYSFTIKESLSKMFVKVSDNISKTMVSDRTMKIKVGDKSSA